MTKKERYLKSLPIYGFITLVYLIDEYAQEENYEECQLIFETLTEYNEKFKADLPTMFNEDARSYLKEAMQEYGLTGEITLNNVPYYAQKVKELVALSN